jgi:ATP-binding cassette subfamily C protein CydD
MLALVVGLGVAGTGATIAQMMLLSGIVARVFLGGQSLGHVSPLLLLLLSAALLRAGLLWAREVAAQEMAVRVKSDTRARLLAHVMRLGPSYTRGECTGELVATTTGGVERLDAYVARYLPQTILSVVAPLLIVAYILPLDAASAVLLLLTGPVIPLLMILVGSYAERHVQRQWTTLARMSAHFLDVVQGLPTLLLFGRAGAERERVARISERFRQRTLKTLRLAFLSGLVLEFLASAAIALVAVMLGIRLVNGGITFERAFLVLLLAPEFYRALRELGMQRHAGMEGKAAARRIEEILAVPVPIHDIHDIQDGTDSPPATTGRRAVIPAGAPTITLTDVGYTYPGADRPALAHISLTLPTGARTALVGRSGGGKSTLASLLVRFLDPQVGAIIANGVALASIPIEAWRARVALVPQQPYLFHGTVRENIRLARPTAGSREVERAAELAAAAEFIARLPRGYETPIGERGARLSAGQAQRLALARAFLKDAPLLILDEPTSSLDPESEALIRQALARLAPGRTVLVIAHRLNTVITADQIAVLDGGQLVEVGSHAALLARGGVYASLVGAWSPESSLEDTLEEGIERRAQGREVRLPL